jgi:hypothetical protein
MYLVCISIGIRVKLRSKTSIFPDQTKIPKYQTLIKTNVFFWYFSTFWYEKWRIFEVNLISVSPLKKRVFTRVGTYVQRGSMFCFVLLLLLLGVRVIAQNISLLSTFTMHSAALPGSLARQPCPAALPGSLARQPCPGSLARQPCPAVRLISTGFDARARSLLSHRTVLQ